MGMLGSYQWLAGWSAAGDLQGAKSWCQIWADTPKTRLRVVVHYNAIGFIYRWSDHLAGVRNNSQEAAAGSLLSPRGRQTSLGDKMLQQIELTDVEKTLLLAADYLEENGWCQNITSNKDGNVCVMVAIYNGGGPAPLDAIYDLERRLNRTVVSWNDDPARRIKEVLATLRQVNR